MRHKIFLIVTVFLSHNAAIAAPTVVTSITPLHLLTKSIMEEVGQPTLLIDNASSPHSFRLKPSNALTIQRADLFIWIGRNLESKLERPLKQLVQPERLLTLSDEALPTILANRHAGIWDDADHHHGDLHSDPHVWLDPDNAIVIAKLITQRLIQLDGKNAARYSANTEELIRNIKQTDQQLQALLEPVRTQSFLILHDALQYFENHYALHSMGALSIDAHKGNSAKRISQLKAAMREQNIHCILHEAMPNDTIITVLQEGTATHATTIDPLGLDLDANNAFYSQLMGQLTNKIAECLKPD